MKAKNAIALLVVVLLIAGWAFLALGGASLGRYDIVPYADAISLGLDLKGGVYVVYEATMPQENQDGDMSFAQRMDSTISVLTSRLSEKGFNEATVSKQGSDRIRVEIPDVKEPAQVLSIIGTPGRLEFRSPEGDVVLDGKNVRSARAVTQQDGSYAVSFQLDDVGTKAFADATMLYVGQQISISLDGEIKSSPVVNDAITTGQGVISNPGMTVEQAQDLATIIMSGAMPLDLEQLEVRTISATLGVDALTTSVRAALIGVLFIMLFMIVIYRLPGVMAALALCIYILLDLLLIAVLPGIQLTLPGIAGIILSIGMAVDANVVIFERVKEELRLGKSVRASVEGGFRRAFTAIIDSNITTLIAALVLGIFGTGTIKSFAYTLAIGVVTSLFTAVTVTRFLLRRMIGLQLVNPALYGVSQKSIDNAKGNVGKLPVQKGLSVTKLFKPACALFALLLVIGLVCGFAFKGLNMGIDFAGGTMITLNMGSAFEVAVVEEEFAKLGVDDVSVAKTGEGGTENTALVRMKDLDDPEREDQLRADVEKNLQAIYPEAAIESAERVGATAGRSLVGNAVLSLMIALVLMLAYIWFRFEIRSGVAAVVALLLTIAAMVSCMSILQVQINSAFIAAILTIVGYSINNTIIIFDRIRENHKKYSRDTMTRGAVADLSVRQSMARTINTTITTLSVLLILYAMGVASIREFALPLILGLVAGVLASVFIAPPIWGIWAERGKARKTLTKPKRV